MADKKKSVTETPHGTFVRDTRKPVPPKQPEPEVVREIVHKLTPTELVTVLADTRMAVHDKQEVARAFVRGGFVNARYESAMVGHIADPVVPLNL